MTPTKTCRLCGLVKPLRHFSTDGHRRNDGTPCRMPKCKPCEAARNRERRRRRAAAVPAAVRQPGPYNATNVQRNVALAHEPAGLYLVSDTVRDAYGVQRDVLKVGMTRLGASRKRVNAYTSGYVARQAVGPLWLVERYEKALHASEHFLSAAELARDAFLPGPTEWAHHSHALVSEFHERADALEALAAEPEALDALWDILRTEWLAETEIHPEELRNY